MPRILITGAAGFLGSHLCDRFIAEGYEVVGMDNLITGDLRNLEHLQSLPQFTFVHHDVSTHIHLNGPLDYILHFASPASPIDYLKIPIQTLKVGSLGTHNCLGLALAKKARILVASTSEVYGDPMVHPQTEAYWGNVNPIGPRGVYDEAKRFQEALTMAYHTYHGLETRIIRIFNTYGPRMRLNDGRVLPAFIGQALRGERGCRQGPGHRDRPRGQLAGYYYRSRRTWRASGNPQRRCAGSGQQPRWRQGRAESGGRDRLCGRLRSAGPVRSPWQGTAQVGYTLSPDARYHGNAPIPND